MTAVRADCLAVSCTLVDAIIRPKNVRHHCTSPATVNATGTTLHKKKNATVFPYQVTASTTTEIPSVTSRLGHARLAAMSTVSVSVTVRLFTPPARAATLVDSTSTALAFTTPVSALRDIQLMASAIDDAYYTVLGKCV